MDRVQRSSMTPMAVSLVGEAALVSVVSTAWSTTAAADRASWQSDAPVRRKLEAEDGSPERVLLEGPSTFALLLPGPMDPREFNQIVVNMRFRRATTVGFEFRRDGQTVYHLNGIQLLPNRDQQVIDAEGIHLHDEPFDELLIVFAAGVGEVSVAGLDLVRCPASALLPNGLEQEWTRIGSDLRLSYGVFVGRPLQAVSMVDPGTRLEFALGTSELIRGEGLRVEVRLGAGERRQVRSYTAADLAGRWKWVSIPMDPWAEQSVELEIEVFSETGQVAGVAVTPPKLVAWEPDPPTVLLITSDTHRADYLGAARSGVQVETPNLDLLASQGVLFEDAMSASNITVPSHVALLTGLGPERSHVVSNLDAISEQAFTMAEAFSRHGYETVAAVSTVLLDPKTSGLGQGFQRFAKGFRGQRDSRFTLRDLGKWLPELQGRPLFVWLHLYDAHASYSPPQRFRRYYPAQKDPRDSSLPELAVHARPYWLEGVRDPDYVESLYRSEISYLDMRLGTILGEPRFAAGIVAFTADHGESLGRRDIWYAHDLLYPNTLRVPLILRWPAGPQGLRVQRPVQNIRLASTLLELAGIETTRIPGESLLDELESGPAEESLARIAIADEGRSCSIESEGWYLVLHLKHQLSLPGAAKRERHQVELYNLRSDPHCAADLLQLHPERAALLRQGLIRRLRNSGEGLLAEGEITQQLRAYAKSLGYTGGLAQAGVQLPADECPCPHCANWQDG